MKKTVDLTNDVRLDEYILRQRFSALQTLATQKGIPVTLSVVRSYSAHFRQTMNQLVVEGKLRDVNKFTVELQPVVEKLSKEHHEQEVCLHAMYDVNDSSPVCTNQILCSFKVKAW